MIAEIIINTSAKKLNRTFDYKVPKELEEQIMIGSKVLVPFGNKKEPEEGFVVGFKETTEYKVKEAYKLVNKPCISLDCGFWINELDGFPRAFVNFALDTIGIEGILKLMEGKENRNCKFTECLSYYDGKELHQFMGKHEGTLAKQILGNDTDKKWSDLWYIFKPYGYEKTLAQMTDEERTNRTKYKSTDSMKEFAKWYKNK